MNLLAVGISHNSAPVRTLERVAIGADELGKVHEELLGCEQLCEVFVVSTCNRVEVYAVAETFHGGLDDVSDVLARHAGAEVSELADQLYVFYAGAAVEHLFAVAAGLDSMVVGEAQILGQLRHSYTTADELGTVGKALHELAQQALRVGKRVHAETDIDAEGASVVSEALTDAERELGTISGRRALLVGAGAMGGLAAAALRRAGIGEVVIANRTAENGQRLVDSLRSEGVPARVVSLDEVEPAIVTSDLVVSCTGAVGAVLTRPMIEGVLAERGMDEHGRPSPLVFCDLGLPRDTAPEIATLDQVTVVDLETLRERLSADGGSGSERAEGIVDEEVRQYLAAQRSAEVTPTVTALRKRAAEVVDAELLQLDSRLPELDEDVRGELTRTVRRVVDKLLHTPTVRVKQLASAPGGTGYADALRELFELDSQTTAAIASTKAAASPDTPEGRTSVSRAGRRRDLPKQDGEDR